MKLPAAPAGLKNAKLAATLVGAGTSPDGAFWSGDLFDHALSHKLHNQVMIDVATKFGAQDNLIKSWPRLFGQRFERNKWISAG